MIAFRALRNPAAQAAQAELRLGLRRAIRAVRVHIRRRVGLVQKSIEFLAVMHTRVGHVVLPDQLVLGIRIHVVLVAVEALAVLLGPARVLVFLPVFRRILLPRLRRLAAAFTSSFSSRLLRCLGTGTMVASTIWPPRAASPFASKCWPKRSNRFSMRPAF